MPSFHFGIPLMSRAMSRDWTLVCRNLARTFESLRRQTSKDFRVLITCHEIPNVDTSGLDVEFILADFLPPSISNETGKIGNDKPAKKRLLGLSLRTYLGEETYFMHLDADDLVHPSLVEFTLKDNNKSGYLVEYGYMFDCESGKVAPMGGDNTPFWKHCGSCAVIYLTLNDLPSDTKDKNCYFMQFRRHGDYADIAEKHGRALSTYPGFMAAYLVNHGDNDTLNRGKVGVKTKYVERWEIADSSELATIFLDFPMLLDFT
ncbi:glycosyltransferase family A protein [Salinicola sp. MH3R3-1]|uniref:glycosyltransferase family A protein n=1 Tax=Salinicola sp. MH3R3-1 TaxID=1928762 RepID=UPI000AB06710|nr:glycosyltransferase family A protein [Salinicola sp. MH3R3-1]